MALPSGPVVVVIKSGALTEYENDGCVIVHPAGSVFYEEKDVVHNAVNETGGVTDVYATFLSPSGTQPLIPAANPGAVCRSRRNRRWSIIRATQRVTGSSSHYFRGCSSAATSS